MSDTEKTLDAERRALAGHYGRETEKAVKIIGRAATVAMESENAFLRNRDKAEVPPEKLVEMMERSREEIYEQRLLKENARDMCTPIGLPARVAARPELSTLPMSRADNYTLDLLRNALTIPTGNRLVNQAMKNGTTVCTVEDMSTALGWYSDRANTLTQGMPSTGPDKPDGRALLTFYEELWHSNQAKTWKSFNSAEMETGKLTIKDSALTMIGLEAEAKVAAALMIMEHAEKGRDDIRQGILADIDNEADKDVFLAVNRIYEEKGMAAIRQDPSLLAPAFEAFFKDRQRIDTYGESYFASFEKHRIVEREHARIFDDQRQLLSPDSFARAFGRNFTPGRSMLEGRYRSTEDIVALLPQEAKLARWLRGEFQLSAAGAYGPADKPAVAPPVRPEVAPPLPKPEF